MIQHAQANPIAQYVRGKLSQLTERQQKVLIVKLQGAALPLPCDVPTGSEKERQRAVGKVVTNINRLRAVIDELDTDAREHVAHVAAGGRNNDGPLTRNEVFATAYSTLKNLDATLDRASQVKKVPPSPFKIRRELVIAEEVVAALNDANLSVTAADTGVAADCFRIVAEYAQFEISDSPRYWIAKAKERLAEI